MATCTGRAGTTITEAAASVANLADAHEPA
jgi:hypothetical protein